VAVALMGSRASAVGLLYRESRARTAGCRHRANGDSPRLSGPRPRPRPRPSLRRPQWPVGEEILEIAQPVLGAAPLDRNVRELCRLIKPALRGWQIPGMAVSAVPAHRHVLGVAHLDRRRHDLDPMPVGVAEIDVERMALAVAGRTTLER